MKHFSLGLIIVLVSILGMHTAAFAQIVPVQGPALILHTPLHEPSTPVKPVTIKIPTFTNSAIVQTHVTLTAPSVSVNSLHVSDSTYTTSVSINNADISTPIHTISNPVTPVVPVVPAPIVPVVPTPIHTSYGGSGGGGSYGYSINNSVTAYPVYAPVSTYTAPQYVPTYNSVASHPTSTITRKAIPLIPEDQMAPANASASTYGASVAGIGTHVSLIGLLLIIAALLLIIVIAKEYQHRKKEASQFARA